MVGIHHQVAVGEQVVADAHVTVEVRTWVAHRPEQPVGVLVVGTGDPGRAAAVLPGLAGPRVVAGLARAGDGVGLPHQLAGVGVDRLDPAAHAVFRTRRAEDDLVLQGHRHDGEGLGVGVVAVLLVPHHFAGRVVERHDVRVERGQVDLVLVDGNAAVHHVAAQLREHVAGQFAVVLPRHRAGGRVDCDDLVERGRDVDHAVHCDRLAVLAFQHAEGQVPDGPQVLDVVTVDRVSGL